MKAESETRKTEIENRKNFAAILERKYLDKGMDVYVRASGTAATTLTLKYVLMPRPTVHQLSQYNDFTSMVAGMGFKHVVFTDGYDEMWTVDY